MKPRALALGAAAILAVLVVLLWVALRGDDAGLALSRRRTGGAPDHRFRALAFDWAARKVATAPAAFVDRRIGDR